MKELLKIGIITLNGYFNYGNRLQNYALQEVIKGLGFEVDTIIKENAKETNGKRKITDRIKSLSTRSLPEVISIVEKKYTNKAYKQRINRRTDIFKEFSQKYINETEYAISEDNILEGLADQYDFFVVGSDQVWNPHYQKGSSIEFLTFAPQQKRVSYAASFGINSIPDEYVDDYSKWLSEMNHISVREHVGANIVEELTGREVEVVLDPTLLLSKDEWLDIAEVASDKPKKGYVLTYFLGKVSKERKSYIQKIAKENDLEIINLAQLNEIVSYLSGPSEFIDYINTADIFLTDSFHGAAFSIMLNTPFIVFDREGNSPSMSSRIDTLLGTFKLESRAFNNFTNDDELFEVDFSKVPSILEVEKEKAMSYLKTALNI